MIETFGRAGWGRVARSLLVWVAVSPQVASAQHARGPFVLREQNPVYQLFYVPFMERADLHGAHELRVAVTLAYSNIFEEGTSATHQLLFDMERLATTFVARYGLTDRVEVGARLSFQSSGGGVLDPLIQGVHDVLGVSNGNREKYPHGIHDVYLRETGGRVLFEAAPRSFSPEDLQLFGRFQVAGGLDRPHALALRVTAKLPTAAAGLGAGGGDGAISLLGRRSWERWHLHGLLGLTSLDGPERLAAIAQDWAGFGGVAAERSLGEGVSAIMQIMGSSRYVGGVGATELDRRPMTLAIGLAGGDRWAWQFAFVEDVPPNSPSADFTVHLQLSTVWD